MDGSVRTTAGEAQLRGACWAWACRLFCNQGQGSDHQARAALQQGRGAGMFRRIH